MEISVNHLKRCDLVTLSGRVDHLTAPQVVETLKSVQESGVYKIIVDLSQVDFISSAGWWALIDAQKASKQLNRGEVVLVGLQPQIRSSMDLVGIGHYFKQYADPVQAIGSF